jgi:hypothetical protein
MFTKFLIFSTLSLASIATAMTSNETEINNLNSLAIVSAQPMTEQLSTEEIVEKQTVPVSVTQVYASRSATKTVYFNKYLWINIRSYLEICYSSPPTDAHLRKLLASNNSDVIKSYLLSPHLKLSNSFMLSNEHLIELSVNNFFDTVTIDMPYRREDHFASGLEALKNSLLPRKVTISSESDETISWQWTFETINRKRVNTEVRGYFLPPMPQRPKHLRGTIIKCRDIYGNPVDIYEPKCGRINMSPIVNNKKIIYNSFLKISTENTLKIAHTFIANVQPIFDKSIIQPETFIQSFETPNLELIYLPNMTETSATKANASKIYLEVTKKFSVFSLK